MKPALTRLLTIVAACGALAYGARAGVNTYSIGFNFGTNEPNGLNLGGLAPTDLAGVPAVAQANWNNLGGLSGAVSTDIVANQNGTAFPTTVGIAWAAQGTWASSGRNEPNGDNYFPTNTPNRILNTGYLDTGNATTTQITITNLPSDLTSPGYDVYIYALGGVQGRGGSYRILNAADQTELKAYQLGSSANAPTNYVMDTGESHNNETGTYLVFRNLTAPGIIVEATTAVNPTAGTPRAPVNAVQLVAASATGEAQPATALNINPSTGQIELSWTPGAGSSGSLVVARAGRRVTAQPVDGATYTGNASFGLGDNLGDDNIGSPNYVVYSGAGNSVTISNVFGSTNYHFAVYSFTGNNYTLLNPPVGNATPPANVASLQFNVPSSIIQGAARSVRVFANYDDGGVIDVTGSTTLTSSAPAVVTFIAGPKAAAFSLGNATLTATYQTFTTQQVVSVVDMSMTHRYSMSGEYASTNIQDSVGSADGFVVTPDLFSAQDGAGMLILSGDENAYVQLPANLVSDYGAVTVEAWVTDIGNRDWARIFDFGVDANRNMFLSPSGVGNGTVRAAITVGGAGAESQLSAANAGAGEHHYAWSINGATRVGRLYIDGKLVAVNTNVTQTPEDIGPAANIWLGRSQYGGDPYFYGQFNEFRIYNGALSPLQIAFNAVTGPNTINSDPGLCTGLTMSMTNTALFVADFGPVTTVATFQNLPGPVNVTSASEVTYSSSAPGVATVSPLGIVTAVGPGSATIQASGFGFTDSVVVTVTELPLTLNHRYSFNGNFDDSVGGAHGFGTGATISFDASNERVQLAGTGTFNNNPSGDYVALPPDLISAYNSITIETWFKETTNFVNFNRVWDFGGQDAGGAGNRYIFFASPANNANNDRIVIRGATGGEQIVNFPRPSQFSEHHVVYVLDASQTTARVYLDGMLVGQALNVTLQPRSMGTVPNMWIGRSQFNVDPWFQGSVNELRIWRGVLTPMQVALSYAAGPDTVITNLSGFAAVTVTNMTVGQVQQSRLTFAGGALSSPLRGALSGVISNWVSSNPSVADVDSAGLVTAVGPGTATISATHAGVTRTSASFTVSAGSPTLAHRYSFTTDATDSVGSAHGANGGAAVFSGGRVILDGSASSYVSLPGGLLSSDDTTFEIWMTYSNNIAANARAWDIGDPASGNYFYFSPSDTANPSRTQGSTVFRYNYGNRGNQERTLARQGRPISGGSNVIHYVHVLSRSRGVAELYINGVLEETYPYWRIVNSEPFVSELIQTEAYIGRATRTNSPPAANLVGAVDEFRIWNGALSKQQVQSSYLQGPDAASPLDAGTLSSVAMTLIDPAMVVGGIQRPIVKGSFSAAGEVDLTRVPGLAFTSSNPGVVLVDADVLKAVGAGTAEIVASYGGITATGTVTVVPKALRLAHRYSFSFDGRDAVGGADGILRGNAFIASNHVVLDGSTSPSTYVDLPSDLISGYDVLTIEAFLSVGASGNQGRLYDFGDRFNLSNQDVGWQYLFMSMTGGNGTQPRVALDPAPGRPAVGEQGITLAGDLRNTSSHIVTVIDSVAHTMSFYTNGVLGGSITNAAIDLAGLSNVYSYLGRSVWPDPFLTGAIDEFRIYYGAFSPSDVAASLAAGPDPERLSASVGGGNVTVSWPATLITEGYTLQVSGSLSPASWAAAGAASLVGDRYQVVIPLATLPNTGAYFRLIK